ncbi:hypothetical protein NHH03_18935 [Stieleria sp. TO1_6]|uniref:hypothetical protein n=1 Tax=Stieleria tagensis TaxID=2956795 RepID=UPI00209A78DD|nr:hypothetical protein [Stieleria tagensis]MCO8123828.1 hypothetical protein [Stieleria tagensis]
MIDPDPYVAPANRQPIAPARGFHALTKRFIIHFGFAAICGGTFSLLTLLFPAIKSTSEFNLALAGLLVGSFAAGRYSLTTPQLLVATAGITWGFMSSFATAILVQDKTATVIWSRFIPALLIAPVIIFCGAWTVMRVETRRS